MPDNVKPISHLKSLLHKPHFRIALIYLITAVLWIVYSDKLLFSTLQDVHELEHFQLIKGLVFVTGTALLIFFLIRNSYSKIKDSNTDLKQRDEQLNHRNKQQAILLEISSILAKNLELKRVLQSVTDSAASLLGHPTTAIYLVDENDIILGATSPPIPPDFPDEFRKAYLKNHPHIAKTLRSKNIVIIENTSKAKLTDEEKIIVETRSLKSILYIPLILDGEAKGVLISGNDVFSSKFSHEEIELAKGLANQSVLAITNAKLYGNLKRYVQQLETNINERKKSEAALIESEDKFRSIIESMNDIILILDRDGQIKFQNPSAQRLLGYSKEDLIGVNPLEIVHPEDIEKAKERLFKVRARTNEGKPTLFRIKQKTGNYVYLEVLGKNMFDNNSIDGIVLFGKDVTEKIDYERKLAEQNDGLRNLNQLAIELSLLSTDENSEEIINKKLKEVTGASLSIFSKFNPENRTLTPSQIDIETGVLEKIVKIIGKKIKQTSSTVSNEMYNDMITTSYKMFDNLYDAVLGSIPKTAAITIQSLLKANRFIAIAYVVDRNLYGTTLLALQPGQPDPAELFIKNYIMLVSAFLQKKKTNEVLKSSEEKFRNLFENHSAIKLIINAKTGAIVNANKSAAKFYGWSVEELEKMNITPFNIMAKEEFLKRMRDSSLSDESRIELKHIKADGSIVDMEVYSSLFTIDSEEYLHTILYDITQKKKVELELIKHSLALEQSPVSIVITNLNGDIEYVNPTFTKISGYSLNEVLNKNPRILKSGEQSEEFYKDMWNTIISGSIWSGVLHNKRKNGELFWESAIISPLKNDNGEITHFVAVKEDITDDVKRENELRKYRENLEDLVEQRTKQLDNVNYELRRQLEKGKILEKQLEESLSKEKEINELKTRFIATVSHEFRTPLSALLSSTQMIQRYSSKWSEEKLNQHHLRIASTIKYLTQLLDDVLTISRADREILKNEPELVNICDLLNSFTDEIRSHIDVERRVNIICEIKEPEIKVDKKLLRHIVINLLTNGIKYSPHESEVNLNATYDNGKLLIIVSDHGLGIPDDEVKYIFDAFYRTKNSIGIQGSGLGLNIVKRAVETMNGTISVNSIVHKGTTFTVTIPIN